MTVQAISPTGVPPVASAGGQVSALRADQPAGKAPLAVPVSTLAAAKPASETADAANRTTSPTDIRNAVEKVKEFVSPVASDIQFSIDEDTGTTVVKIIDRTTDEVIRQIPSEEMLDIAKALDRLQGLLIKQKA
ncbi:MAG: flagellar protein FlaG [Pseudomonas sp.]|jgi:flagellar protein FlaG|nr:flagellar protein FlaG [Pseudomonas sp.]